ncbi:MAG: chemotaxis protein CheB, partial [Pseudomonadota bacterium]
MTENLNEPEKQKPANTEPDEIAQLRDREQQTSTKADYVVAVGASAGGLDALEEFFRAVPARNNIAFVVIQHLSPDFKSMMDELLARHTDMKIHRAQT